MVHCQPAFTFRPKLPDRWDDPSASFGGGPFHSHGPGQVEIYSLFGILVSLRRNHPNLHRFLFTVTIFFAFIDESIQATSIIFYVICSMGSLAVAICSP